jgi:hypothetical protein
LVVAIFFPSTKIGPSWTAHVVLAIPTSNADGRENHAFCMLHAFYA